MSYIYITARSEIPKKTVTKGSGDLYCVNNKIDEVKNLFQINLLGIIVKFRITVTQKGCKIKVSLVQLMRFVIFNNIF